MTVTHRQPARLARSAQAQGGRRSPERDRDGRTAANSPVDSTGAGLVNRGSGTSSIGTEETRAWTSRGGRCSPPSVDAADPTAEHPRHYGPPRGRWRVAARWLRHPRPGPARRSCAPLSGRWISCEPVPAACPPRALAGGQPGPTQASTGASFVLRRSGASTRKPGQKAFPKLTVRVRFPSPALTRSPRSPAQRTWGFVVPKSSCRPRVRCVPDPRRPDRSGIEKSTRPSRG
jgi:hypothetical protein